MPANGRSRISSTAGRSVSIASSGGCRRAWSSRARTRSTSDDHAGCSGSISVSVRPSHSSPDRRLDVAGHRPAGLGHDVGERGVADVELPQRRAGAGPRRAVAVQRQPGDQLERLGPLEADRPGRRGRRRRPAPSSRTSSDHAGASSTSARAVRRPSTARARRRPGRRRRGGARRGARDSRRPRARPVSRRSRAVPASRRRVRPAASTGVRRRRRR